MLKVRLAFSRVLQPPQPRQVDVGVPDGRDHRLELARAVPHFQLRGEDADRRTYGVVEPFRVRHRKAGRLLVGARGREVDVEVNPVQSCQEHVPAQVVLRQISYRPEQDVGQAGQPLRVLVDPDELGAAEVAHGGHLEHAAPSPQRQAQLAVAGQLGWQPGFLVPPVDGL